ncbi:MAG: hypothetical protein CSB48_10550 [Proteobacteria bacterium]|nr:MAG: hypothetical protein CSB48_10550 [Pseudomonadota bacterium]
MLFSEAGGSVIKKRAIVAEKDRVICTRITAVGMSGAKTGFQSGYRARMNPSGLPGLYPRGKIA